MCGIIGYVGNHAAAPILLEGLRRPAQAKRPAGESSPAGPGETGGRKLRHQPHPVGHTHGAPSDANAHPHLDRSGRLALVHNGVIENYQALRAEFEAAGHEFRSQTDSDVLAHLIGACYDVTESGVAKAEDRLVAAVRSALQKIAGTGFLVGAVEESPTTSSRFPPFTNALPRPSRSSRSSCSATTSPSPVAATSTSHETSPRA